MTSGHVYPGRDLEAMSFATNYHRWILDEFRPFIGSRVVEVGAGRGDFSHMLLGEHPEALWLVEPSDLFPQLKKKLRKHHDRLRSLCTMQRFARLLVKFAALALRTPSSTSTSWSMWKTTQQRSNWYTGRLTRAGTV